MNTKQSINAVILSLLYAIAVYAGANREWYIRGDGVD